MKTFCVFVLGSLFGIAAWVLIGSIDSGPKAAANTPKDVRDAQNLASVCASAIAAGSLELQHVDSVWAAICVLRRGTNGSESFSDTTFQVPNMSEEQMRKAMRHLRWDPGRKDTSYQDDCLVGLVYDRDHGIDLVDTPPPPPEVRAAEMERIRKRVEADEVPMFARVVPEGSLAIARAEAINMAIASYIQARGRENAESAWAEATGRRSRYILLAPFLAFAPIEYQEYMPEGFGIVLPESLSAPLEKVALIGGGRQLGY